MVSAIDQFRNQYEEQPPGLSRGRARRSVGASHVQACNPDDDDNDETSDTNGMLLMYLSSSAITHCRHGQRNPSVPTTI